MVFTPEDAYTMGKHLFHIFLSMMINLYTNGVKQGGMMFPVLFNVYIDELSCALNCTNIGGGGVCKAKL